METVQPISSLQSYQEYKQAEKDLKEYRQRREQFERKAFELWDESKAKMKEVDLASSLSESEKLEKEAAELRRAAKAKKEEYDKWQAEQPPYGNILGKKQKALEAELKELIPALMERARDEIDDAVEVLQVILKGKNSFSSNTFNWIKNVGSILDLLKEIKNRLK